MSRVGRTVVIAVASAVIGIPLLAIAGVWGWLLLTPNPVALPLASWFPYPVACTLRGCITSQAWQRQDGYAQIFAQHTQAATPDVEESLTTLIRQHLVDHAVLRSPVTIADARRYRIDVLHIKDQSQLQAVLPIALADYDQYVILPYLQQEALKHQRNITEVPELYAQLSKERSVLVLPLAFTWDTSKGVVVKR